MVGRVIPMGRLSVFSLLVVVWSLLLACDSGQKDTASAPAEPEEANGKVFIDTEDMLPEPEVVEEDEPEDSAEDFTTVFTSEDGELLCPVMEVILDSEDVAEGRQDYKGTRYWFSTAEAAAMFRENPDKFAR